MPRLNDSDWIFNKLFYITARSYRVLNSLGKKRMSRSSNLYLLFISGNVSGKFSKILLYQFIGNSIMLLFPMDSHSKGRRSTNFSSFSPSFGRNIIRLYLVIEGSSSFTRLRLYEVCIICDGKNIILGMNPVGLARISIISLTEAVGK